MRILAIAFTAAMLWAPNASAATYPISGKWAYDDSSGTGSIACGDKSIIQFAGNRRFETGGKAPPDYRNISVEQRDANTYRIVDLFFNGMQTGKVAYTLTLVDSDRIQIEHEIGRAIFKLRSCH